MSFTVDSVVKYCCNDVRKIRANRSRYITRLTLKSWAAAFVRLAAKAAAAGRNPFNENNNRQLTTQLEFKRVADKIGKLFREFCVGVSSIVIKSSGW